MCGGVMWGCGSGVVMEHPHAADVIANTRVRFKLSCAPLRPLSPVSSICRYLRLRAAHMNQPPMHCRGWGERC